MLSNARILDELRTGRIVIEPFTRTNLGTNSYDVSLGPWWWSPNIMTASIDPWDEASIKSYWCGPYNAEDFISHNDRHPCIVVPPGQTILTHTAEVIGGRSGISTSMRARSSIGRVGLSVCKCAGAGDVGYVAPWTMEISNHTKADVHLRVGMRVAQISFDDVGEVVGSYKGKYGSGIWTPHDMLPKLYLDREMKGVSG